MELPIEKCVIKFMADGQEILALEFFASREEVLSELQQLQQRYQLDQDRWQWEMEDQVRTSLMLEQEALEEAAFEEMELEQQAIHEVEMQDRQNESGSDPKDNNC
jgi:hypothetical protein